MGKEYTGSFYKDIISQGFWHYLNFKSLKILGYE